MALYSIQGETLSEIADAIREKTETEEPIQTNEMSSMIRKIEGSSPNAVLYTEQSLTDEQKAQARENIGAAAIGEGGGSSENAVLYTEQDLTSEQKNQARKNIDIHVGEEPLDADEGAVWIDPDGMNLILGNAIMAEDINEGDVEIFGSFISEDSVIAKDENSDGNINLQTFVKGEEPSVEYATKEELAALTAADVGAAPAGYVVETGQYTNYADALVRIKSVFASMNNGEKRYLFADVLNGSVWSGEFPSGGYFVEIYREWSDYGIVTFINNAYMKIVVRISGSWGDFCYDNPHMLSGVEYRTTERHDGKPVYKKVDNSGVIWWSIDQNTWSTEAKRHGAAPAGFGLGEEVGKYCADCNTATKSGFYYVNFNTSNIPAGVGGPLLVQSVVATYGIDIYQTIKNGACVLQRYYSSYAGAWQPWEWVNPPMEIGVEYRTTERYEGKPVYVRKIDCGTFAVGTDLIWTEEAVSGIVRAEANIADALPLTIGYNIGDIRQGVFVYRNEIGMYGETPGFINTLYVTIHYTKG